MRVAVVVIAGIVALSIMLAGCSDQATTPAPSPTPPPVGKNTSTYTAGDLYQILHTVDVDLGGDGDLAGASALRAELRDHSPMGTINVLRAGGGTVLTPRACAGIQSSSLSLSPAGIGDIPGATFASLNYDQVDVTLLTFAGDRLPQSFRTRLDSELTTLLTTCAHMKLMLSTMNTLAITLTPVTISEDGQRMRAFDERIVLPGGGAAQVYRFVEVVEGNLVILASASGADTFTRLAPEIKAIVAAAANTKHPAES